MDERQQKRIYLAQNFLRSTELVRRLLRKTEIGPGDTVLEIGAGRGIITSELARVAKRVIAIEKDPDLVRLLQKRFGGRANVEIAACDFSRFPLPADGEYKIFANIPFNRTADIMRKLLDSPHQPQHAYLIMQREPARKFAGIPAETLFSLLAKLSFTFRIIHRFDRTDFEPAPSVESVLLAISKRSVPLVDRRDMKHYGDFVNFGFTRYKPNLRLAYKNVFTYKKWKRAAHDIGFPINATPTQLTFDQWLRLYGVYKALQHGRDE